MNPSNVNAEIITIGDELLIGQVIDTNSAWIAQQFNLLGIAVSQISSISDDKQHIINALDLASLRSDLIIVTGGLGPTKDDRTKETVAAYFNGKLIKNELVFNQLSKWLSERNAQMNELNARQADVPDNCEVLPNHYGTAPGMWFNRDQVVFVFLPGVPFEMKGIMTDVVIPRLKTEFQTSDIYHQSLMLTGIAESSLAILISDWEKQLPETIKLAYLPSPGRLRLRLSSKGDQLTNLKTSVQQEIDKLIPIVTDYLYSEEDETMEVTVGKLLKNYNKSICTAESCTGGKISSLLTSIPGSSHYFKGTVVAYANEIKINVLGVNNLDIDLYGAVSQQVVEQMASNVRVVFKTDYAIATSGIAGPDGGSEDKPVGTTWIAVSSSKKTLSKKFIFNDNRERNIERAAVAALNELRKMMLQDEETDKKK